MHYLSTEIRSLYHIYTFSKQKGYKNSIKKKYNVFISTFILIYLFT